MTDVELSEVVRKALDNFYRCRLQKLTELKLNDALRRKNPYLFKATGLRNGPEIVESILRAYMSSSEETIFGREFFEPIVRAVCSGVHAGSHGMDVIIETDDNYTAISVKSGPSWGNSSQMAQIRQDFEYRRRVYDNSRIRKQFRALLGHCYGRKKGEPGASRPYAVRSGQAFWEELTGEPDFYIRLADAMGNYPDAHSVQYHEAWEKAINRFGRDFLNRFCLEDGSIDWHAFIQFNSGSDGR